MATRISQEQLNKFISPEAAMAPYQRAQQQKMQEMESAAAMERQQADADARLAQLIKGHEVEQGRIDQNFSAAQDEAARLGLDPKKVAISAGVNFRNINPESEGLAGLLGLQYRQQENDEKKVAQLSDRITKSNLPRQAANMRSVEQSTASVDKDGNPVGGILTNPNYAVKSVGPVVNMIPDGLKPMALNVGEKLGMVDKGAANEARAIQQIINVDTKEMSGVAVTAFENARNRLAQGLAAGASPELIRQYTQEAYKALQDVSQNVESGYNPRIREMYKQFGGTLPSQDLSLGGGASPKAPGIDQDAIRRERARRQGR